MILITAHDELDAPFGDKHKHDEISILQLYELFYRSHGIVHTLPDKAFSATGWHSSHVPSHVRIGNTNYYWEGKHGDGINAISVDLTSIFLVTGMATEGIWSTQYVTQYSVMTSKNGLTWRLHGDFVANFDKTTICKVQFDRPVFARFVKLTVVKFSTCPCMRMDVLVYDGDFNGLISEINS